ncbi:hypothetical protein KRR39_10330 [Nocardioides panacis]|uniref:Uncharacterized protein n=1 Tax=Nocardioides panacis TaxID=2849501 RepID=A0A975T3A5_9ACTN|nr:hypothetical protein [Nocardioides panacis]QWZ10089.1 hypothetical protein KRR39_10330 [Nocardioides panacis]
MRRTLTTILAAVLAVAVLGGVAAVAAAGSGGSTVTRARLERNLPGVFSNLYVQQAHLLGRTGVTPKNLHAKAMCDKHGPDVADVGPGGDWICLMSWTDPNVPMPSEGYGKFELNVHSNDCYTAAGPSKLTGFLNLTDQHGREVTNPVFEFDGCFDPATSNTATGVFYPSVLAISSPSVTPDGDGRVGPQVTCGTGSQGCAGTITARAGNTNLGTVPFKLKEESTAAVRFTTPLPSGTKEVAFQVKATDGFSSPDPVTLPVQ